MKVQFLKQTVIPPDDPRIQPLRNKDDIKGVDIKRNTTVVAKGPGDVWTRFIGNGLVEYFSAFYRFTGRLPGLDFIASGRGKNTDSKIQALLKAGVPLNRTVPYINSQTLKSELHTFPGSTILSHESKPQIITGAFISTLPDLHLTDAELFQGNITTIIEKPIALPRDLEKAKALIKSPNIFGTDFFIYSQAFQYLMERRDLIESIGDITEIHGRCAEPWPVDRDWLLNENISGGGLGIDCVVHPLAMVDYFLRTQFGKGLEEAMLLNYFVGRYPEAPNTGNGETYFNAHFKFKNINIHVDGGKGIGGLEGGEEEINYPYHGITIIGSNGRIELCIGTEYHDPYILATYNLDQTQDELIVFKEGGLGYAGIMRDMHLKMLGTGNETVLGRLNSVNQAAHNSTRRVADVYERAGFQNEEIEFGEKPYISDDLEVEGRILSTLKRTKEPNAEKYSLKAIAL